MSHAPMNARSSKLAAKMWSWSVEKLRVATQIDRYQARLILVPLMATLALAAMLLLLEKMLRLFDFVVKPDRGLRTDCSAFCFYHNL